MIQVAALRGGVHVFNAEGMNVANLMPGRALNLTPQDAGASAPSTMSGCVVKSGDVYTLTDETSSVKVQLRGSGLRAGRHVQVTGTTVGGATAAGGATQVIAVTGVKALPGTCTAAGMVAAGGAAAAGTAAAAGGIGTTTAIVAGVAAAAVAATAGAVAANSGGTASNGAGACVTSASPCTF